MIPSYFIQMIAEFIVPVHTPEPRFQRAESGQKGALEEFSGSNDIHTDAA